MARHQEFEARLALVQYAAAVAAHRSSREDAQDSRRARRDQVQGGGKVQGPAGAVLRAERRRLDGRGRAARRRFAEAKRHHAHSIST
eukprot:2452370-Prymnesium_polylepis.1